MRREAITVTGLGCVCAGGKNLPETMGAMYAGRRCPVFSTRIRTSLNKEFPVFEIPGDLRAPDGLPVRRNASRTSLLALIATREALNHAGWSLEDLKGRRVGVCMGTTVGCTLNNEPFYRSFRMGERPDPAPATDMLDNNPSLLVARALGVRGPAITIANACSSGADAVGLARSWIASGLCEVAIAGGADELSRITRLGFASLLITSSEPCRPFDRRRSGLNLGEGAGVMVLESRGSLQARGAQALAEVAGYACAADAYHPTAPHPQGRGLRRAILGALRDAGARPEDVDFVNAHGTATPDNDRVEGQSLADLLPTRPPVASTKSYTGHTLGASGGIEAVFTVQALLDRRAPATVGFEEADPECAITPTTANTDLRARLAISNSLAFGGNNSVLVFRRDW